MRQDLKKIEGILQSGLDTCRSLAAGSSPTHQTRGGLLAAVQSLAVWIEAHHSVTLHIRTRGQEWGLEEAVADHFFRIVQEAVTNAIKHGHAQHITIALESTSKRCVVSIRGDGRGLTDNPNSGMGHKIMRYRARLMGAHLTISNLFAGGARVRCCLLKHKEPLITVDRHAQASRIENALQSRRPIDRHGDSE